MISPDFSAQLHRLDRTLSLKLDRAKQRYVIYRKDRQNVPRETLIIENSGDFCYPNYNHIVRLYQMDSWSNKNLIKDIDEYNERLDDDSNAHMHFLSDEMSKIATRTRYY